MKRIAFAFAALLAASCSPAAEQDAATGPASQAETAAQRELLEANADALARERFGESVIDRTIFFGDVNSDGVEDALGIYQLNDGAAPIAMVMWNEGGQLTRRRDARIEGQNPREPVFSDGRVHLTVDVDGQPQQVEIFAD